jgi:hypothetical protein
MSLSPTLQSAATSSTRDREARRPPPKSVNFYSIRMNAIRQRQISQLTQNTTLYSFYSRQMSGYKLLLTNHYSPILATFAARLKTRLSSCGIS